MLRVIDEKAFEELYMSLNGIAPFIDRNLPELDGIHRGLSYALDLINKYTVKKDNTTAYDADVFFGRRGSK